MSSSNYQQLMGNLNFDIALRWLEKDVDDDFFQDPIRYVDILDAPNEYLQRRRHRLLQVDAIPHWLEYVPKKNRMLREAIHLRPTHRVIYLAILHHFLPRLDSKLTRAVYSYRRGDPNEQDAYPFFDSIARWKTFINDFRDAALQSDTGAILITDIASFYDHINCDRLCMTIKSLLGAAVDDVDEAVISLLNRLLNMWSINGFGIPQNIDPSSFLGSMYLHAVDYEVSSKYRMFRYVDDIRIVAKSEAEALDALHDLQRALARERMFLAADKTEIIEVGSDDFERLMDVEDDQKISQAEETIASGDCDLIRDFSETLFERLEHHSGRKGDERKFRAFANRLMDVTDFPELTDPVYSRLVDFVIPRLSTHPSRTDYWAKILAAKKTKRAVDAAVELLISHRSAFDWQRFHLWRMLLHFDPPLPNELLDAAVSTSNEAGSELVASQAIIFVGKFGQNQDRENLYRVFSSQASFVVRRAILIAMQELPSDLRDSYYSRALQVNSDHHELVSWISSRQSPYYGERYRSHRKCQDPPREVEVKFLQGVGLVHGTKVRFRLSRGDYGYD